jgi:CubicO group peptidase (beta-lactamase class C family)
VAGVAVGCLPALLLGAVLGAVIGVWAWIEVEDEAALDPLSDFNVTEEQLSLDETRKYVDRLVQEYLADAENVGLVVALIEGKESRVFGYGCIALDNEQPPDGDTVFELASAGKTFTTTVMAEMHLKGELSWDDPLQAFLPESVHVPQHSGRAVTLFDLATQTSGLPSMPPNFQPGDPLNPYAAYTVEEMYAGLSQSSFSAKPGERYEYSNFGFGLLGHALERKAGKSYEALVIERVCDPLGLDSTRMTLDESLRARLATPHDGGKAVVVWEDTTMAGAGSFLSTAHDMVKYVRAHWPADDGSDRPLARIAAETTRKRRATDVPSRSMGLGWHIDSENALDILWHNGGAGGSCSYVAFLMEPPVGVVVLSNSSNPVDELGHTMLYLLVRH